MPRLLRECEMGVYLNLSTPTNLSTILAIPPMQPDHSYDSSIYSSIPAYPKLALVRPR